MSTNSECILFEYRPNQWYYALEAYFDNEEDEDRDNSNWIDEADCYGPFPNEEATHQHLSDHHANPGGFYVAPYSADEKPSPALDNLVKKAPAMMKQFERPSFRRW